MQEQITTSDIIISDSQITTVKQLITSNYLAASDQQQKHAHKQLINLLHLNDRYFQMIIQFINPCYNATKQFKLACCSILKNFCYCMAKQQMINKSKYIQGLYNLIIITGVPKNMRQLLGMGVEHILNDDQKQQYKHGLIKRIIDNMQQIIQFPQNYCQSSSEILYGFGTLILAYMNSLVQPQNLANFFIQIIPIISKVVNISLEYATNYDGLKQRDCLFIGPSKIFQIIQIAIERMFDEEQLISEEIQTIKKSEFFLNTIIIYLHAFMDNKTLITQYPTLNYIKQSILQIVNILNCNAVGDYPITITQNIFLTFIIESLNNRYKKRQQQNDQHVQQILCRCMEIVQTQIASRVNFQIFNQHKIDIIFALLMYSKTTQNQKQYFRDAPQKFVQIAQDYTQGFSKSPIIKVRAANMIKTFIGAFDEGLKNIVQLVIIFITSSLGSHSNEDQVLQTAKKQFQRFDFWGLNPVQKIDIGLMILSLISPYIMERQQLYQIVMALLLSQAQILSMQADEIVLSRLTRVIGYYPTAIYFAFIKNLMDKSRIFVLEGVCTFERISKNRAFMSVFPHINYVFEEIIDFIDVSDSIFEQIVMNNYQNALQKNQPLYMKVIYKLSKNFTTQNNINDSSSKQKIILSINYLYKLIKRQKDSNYSNILEAQFLKMYQYGKHIQLLQDSFIQVYELIVQKYVFIDNKVLQFAIQFSNQQRLAKYSQTTAYFRFLNKLLVKTDNQDFIITLYQNLDNFILYRASHNVQIIKDICFTLSFIHLTNRSLLPAQGSFQILINKIVQKQTNSHWYKFLICHIIYVHSQKTRQQLIVSDKYYSLMIDIFQTYYRSKIQRKVIVLAMLQLLNHQPDKKLCQQIVKFCIKVLGQQYKAYQSKGNSRAVNKSKTPAEMRRYLADDRGDQQPQEERMEDVALYEDKTTFQEYKHPFKQFDEFEMFKMKILTSQNWNQMVSDNDRQDLSKMCQMTWHKDKIRKIFRVNKNL